ncbi:TaqI family restriction endonuclease [Flavivirga rizhaonensis]|uniref:Uncharacterized protein n=1 Tax=Flavivirga rizhaonensis TaxID=2559571 RepID=A0A4S1DRT2_9FLAO|nr:TaqI family restriction endonuclease [Flavivirga rizhaonensis]TGV00680.1 hypothetical protein EM932_18470 [Flavivirga rizhaonensis]
MAILDVIKYSNHLELFKISSKEIENQILSFKLTFINNRNQKAEWGVRFPTFLDSFYKYIYNNDKLPSQDEFYNYYLANNKSWFNSTPLTKEVYDGLKARIYRTYPSLIRDLHFSKLISENATDYKVIYNTNLDVKEGIDLLVIVNNKNIAINLYTKTKRAVIGRIKKESRHIPYDNITYIELPVEFNGSNEIGDFFLYGNREIAQLEEKIKLSS